MPRQQTTNKAPRDSSKVPTSFQYTGPVLPRPCPEHQAPAAPTFGQIVKEGFGFGVGSAVARQMVEKLFGTTSAPTVPSVPTVPKKEDPITSPFLTDSQRIAYNQCIIEGGSHTHCQELLQ